MAGARVTQRHVASHDDIAYHEGQGLLVPLSEVDNPTVGGWGRCGWKRGETSLDLLLYVTVWVTHIGWKTHLGSRTVGPGLKPHRPAHAYDPPSMPSFPLRNCRRWARRRRRRPTCFDGDEKGCKNYACFSSQPLHQGIPLPSRLCIALPFVSAKHSVLQQHQQGVYSDKGLRHVRALGEWHTPSLNHGRGRWRERQSISLPSLASGRQAAFI